jgi:hypothetical protein
MMTTPDVPVFRDRRQTHRIAVQLPLELENGKGVTRDVSASGVFFLTDVSFSIGTPITFCLLLEQVDPLGPLRVRCQGQVVRLECCKGKAGVAVAISEHYFDPAELSGPFREQEIHS